MNRARTVGFIERNKRREAATQRKALRRRLRRKYDPEYAERLRQYERDYQKRNPERVSAARKAWKEKNREQIRAYDRRYFQLNPARQEYLAMKCRERRAKGKGPARMGNCSTETDLGKSPSGVKSTIARPSEHPLSARPEI